MSNEAGTIYRERWHLPIIYAFSVVMILGLHSIYYPLHVVYASGLPKHITVVANAGLAAILLATITASQPRRLANSAFTLLLWLPFFTYLIIHYLLLPSPYSDAAKLEKITISFGLAAVLGGLLAADNKSAIRAVSFVSAPFVLFGAIALARGDIALGTDTFQNIFSSLDNERAPYQTINLFIGLFAVSISALFLDRSLLRIILVSAVISGCIFIQIVVGGRGAIVATVIALLLTFLIRLGAWKSLLIATVGGIAAAFALMALDIDLTRATAIWRFEDVLIWDATDPSMRLSLWTEAVQMWLRHPLWGAGTDAFIASRGDQIYVHNFILEILAEYGLLGLVLFLAPFIILIARRDRVNAANNHLIILSIFFVVCFAFSGEIKDLAPLVFTMALVRA